MIRYGSNINRFDNKILDYNRNLGNCVSANATGQNFGSVSLIGEYTVFDKDTIKTISTWVRLKNVYNEVNFGHGILIMGDFNIGGRLRIVSSPTNRQLIQVWWEGVGIGNMLIQINVPVSSELWVNLTIVQKGIDPTDWLLYVNGARIFPSSFINNLNNTASINPTIIQLNSKGTTSGITAYMGMFALFDRELSLNEAISLYRSNGYIPRGLYNNRLLHYSFNERSGRLVRNQVGDYNHIAANLGYTDSDLGIPDQSTNVTYCDSYSLLPITS